MPSQLSLSLTDDQLALQDAVEKLLRRESTPQHVREAASGHDPRLWSMLTELGLPVLRASEEAGGLNGSLMDLALVAEEGGKFLASAPLVESMAVAQMLSAAGLREGDLMDEITSGAVVGLALHPVEPGKSQVIPGGAVADIVLGLEDDTLMAWRKPSPLALSSDMGAIPLASLSLGTGGAFESSEEIARGPEAVSAWRAAVEEWKLGTAAALVGVSAEALRLASVYANERTQFGKKIGSFQAIAHPLADSATDIEGARLLVWQAINAIANGDDDAAAMVSMAFWWATDAAGKATERALRAFGGYGVSLEQDIQLYYRRAKALSLVLGDPESELARAGDRMWAGHASALPNAGAIGIDFNWGEEADALANHLRAIIDENMTDELRAKKHHSTKGHSKPFAQVLAKQNMLYPDMSPEYGGQSCSEIAAAAANGVWEDIDWNRTAIGVTQFLLHLTLMWGSDEAKAEIVPKFTSGEAVGCLGLSEPQSGSDVFGAQFKATRDGDDWILNGQKMFTTGGHIGDYILMLTRSSSGGAKHEGLSMFIVPMDTPGVEVHPVLTLQDERTNITYFSDVRVPAKYLLGEADAGVRVMQSTLELEHGGIIYHYTFAPLIRHAVAWAQTPFNGARPIDDANVRRRLARALTIAHVSEGISRRDVWAKAAGVSQIAYGPMAKVFSTEGLRTAATEIVSLAGAQALLARNDDLHHVELTMRRAIAMTIYGGTSEIHRSLIAEQFLGLPKSRS